MRGFLLLSTLSLALSFGLPPNRFNSFTPKYEGHTLRASTQTFEGIQTLISASEATLNSQSSVLTAITEMSDKGKSRISEQLLDLDSSYPGGLKAYIEKSQSLLQKAVEGGNPFEGYSPAVPAGVDLSYDSELSSYEKAGLEVAKDSVFVLVAGGLGERLGFSGIKVSLEPYTACKGCYLSVYADFLKAIGDRTGKIPELVIMTSGDTDAATRDLLQKHSDFGLPRVTIVEQKKVPAISDIGGSLALKDGLVETKPHGHGDVHHLLSKSGHLPRWSAEGVKKVAFIQDTNALVINALMASLGVNEERGHAMTSICIPRFPGEAAGAVTLLRGSGGRPDVVVNVEYNFLKGMLEGGDVADPASEDGYSAYPGNANNLILDFPAYKSAITGPTEGVVSEFVNPKFKEDGRQFKKPTRLECMMQDLPYLLSSGDEHGFVQFPRWLSFSPAKNDPGSGRGTGRTSTGTVASGEGEGYACNIRKLVDAGADAAEEEWRDVDGLMCYDSARVFLSPRFCLMRDEVREKCKGVKVTSKSALYVEGEGVRFEGLDLDGGLVCICKPGAKVTFKNAKISNEGWALKKLEGEEGERDTIRGYVVDENGTERVVVEEGEWVFDENGLRRC